MYTIDKELAADIRNKLQAPQTALEKLVSGGKISQQFLELALRELKEVPNLLQQAGH